MTPAEAVTEIDKLITLHLEGTQRATAHAVLYRAPPALDSGDAPAALGALRRVLAAFDGHHSPAATPDHRRALAALRAAQLTPRRHHHHGGSLMVHPVPHPLAMRPRLTVGELLDSLDGAEIEGGCGDCRAVQRIERVRGLARVTKITVMHDDDCPALARKTGRW